VLCSDLYAISQKVAEESGFTGHFMGFGQQKTGFVAHAWCGTFCLISHTNKTKKNKS
jgi:hypothetical protein